MHYIRRYCMLFHTKTLIAYRIKLIHIVSSSNRKSFLYYVSYKISPQKNIDYIIYQISKENGIKETFWWKINRSILRWMTGSNVCIGIIMKVWVCDAYITSLMFIRKKIVNTRTKAHLLWLFFRVDGSYLGNQHFFFKFSFESNFYK